MYEMHFFFIFEDLKMSSVGISERQMKHSLPPPLKLNFRRQVPPLATSIMPLQSVIFGLFY